MSSINLGLLNLGSIDLEDQFSVASGILGLMNSFCLGSSIGLDSLLGLDINDEVDMFLQLAQLAQLQSLGFLDVLGAQNLIQSNLLFGGQGDELFNSADFFDNGDIFDSGDVFDSGDIFDNSDDEFNSNDEFNSDDEFNSNDESNSNDELNSDDVINADDLSEDAFDGDGEFSLDLEDSAASFDISELTNREESQVYKFANAWHFCVQQPGLSAPLSASGLPSSALSLAGVS